MCGVYRQKVSSGLMACGYRLSLNLLVPDLEATVPPTRQQECEKSVAGVREDEDAVPSSCSAGCREPGWLI